MDEKKNPLEHVLRKVCKTTPKSIVQYHPEFPKTRLHLLQNEIGFFNKILTFQNRGLLEHVFRIPKSLLVNARTCGC